MMARNSWLRIWADAWSLGIEASSVIGLRAIKIAAGGAAAEKEAYRMVSEKIEASLTLQRKALNGGLGNTALDVVAKTLGHFRPKVRANRRRLTRRSWLAGGFESPLARAARLSWLRTGKSIGWLRLKVGCWR